MIEQQLYTRSSKGLYMGNAGFDTVRISSGLDSAEAQSYHKFYEYKANDAAGTTEDVPVISRRVLSNGKVMLNCSSPYEYQSYDGYKKVFISHSFIMDKDSAELREQAEDVRQLAGVSEFIDFHDDGSNDALPQLDVLPFEDAHPDIAYVKSIVSRFNADFFSKIVYASMNAVLENKRVYIVIDNVQDCYDALDIMKTIYYFMPVSTRDKLGYITLLNNQNIPEGINVAFVSHEHLNKLKSGNLFDIYIGDDYCFDTVNQQVLFNGKDSIDENSVYLKLVKKAYTDIDCANDCIAFLDNQVASNVTMANCDLVSKFILEASSDELAHTINMYFDLRNAFPSVADAHAHVLELIISASKDKGNDLNVEELDPVCKFYNVCNDNDQDVIFDLIIKSVAFSKDKSSEEFFDKLSVCEAYGAIGSYLQSQYINKDSDAIVIYYGKVFKKCQNANEIMMKVSNIENDRICQEDGLPTNKTFIQQFGNRINELYSATPENDKVNFLSDLQNKLNGIHTTIIVNSIDKYIEEQINAYVKKLGSAYDVDIDTNRKLLNNFRNYINNNSFVQEANTLCDFFYVQSNRPFESIINYFNMDVTFGEDKLKTYFEKYFASHKLNGEFLAYTYVHFDPISKTIDISNAFRKINSVETIVNYAEWLAKNFKYYRSVNPLKSSRNHYDPNEEKVQKYVDLANVILKALYNSDDELDKREFAELRDTLETALEPENPDLEYLWKDFCKREKRALDDKEPGVVEIAAPKVKKEKKSKRDDDDDDFGSDDSTPYDDDSVDEFEGQDKKKKIILISIISAVIVALVAGGVTAAILISKNKNKTPEAPKTTVTQSVKETTTEETTTEETTEEKSTTEAESTTEESTTEAESTSKAESTTKESASSSTTNPLAQTMQNNNDQ